MEYDELVDEWHKSKSKIINLIASKIRKKSEIDDILQDVFIKFWNNKIKEKDKILPWLMSTTRFTIADYYRKNKKLEHVDTIPADIKTDTEFSIISEDESKKLLPIIFSLPHKYRNILLMSDIYGLSHKEISLQFDLSLSCVKTRVVRARKLLAGKMHECCRFSYDKYGNITQCEENKAYYDCLKKFEKT